MRHTRSVEEQSWMYSYLAAHAETGAILDLIRRASNAKTEALAMEALLLQIKNAESGKSLIANLKNALRQRRYRAPQSGHIRRSFTFTKTTSAKLERLAKKLGNSQTSTLSLLIEQKFDELHISPNHKRSKRTSTSYEPTLSEHKIDSLEAHLNELKQSYAQHLFGLEVLEKALSDYDPNLLDQFSKHQIAAFAQEKLNLVTFAIERGANLCEIQTTHEESENLPVGLGRDDFL